MKDTNGNSPFLTYSEAASYCRINRSTLWRAVKAGRLRKSGTGAAVRFRRAELDRFMDSGGRD